MKKKTINKCITRSERFTNIFFWGGGKGCILQLANTNHGNLTNIEIIYTYSWIFVSSGQYCINKRSRCPAGRTLGFVSWDDDDDNSNFTAKGGTLPGGRYDHNTEIRFCSRTDGNKRDPIHLPSKTPFFLLAYGSYECRFVNKHTYSESDIEGIDVE